jgi:hypothetical protein
MDNELVLDDIMYRSEENLSQIRKINIKTAVTEICLPIDETIFHERNASG